ncbi:hypothetical protein ANTPLA_LOCUS10500 [Anthophora plagiata]
MYNNKSLYSTHASSRKNHSGGESPVAVENVRYRSVSGIAVVVGSRVGTAGGASARAEDGVARVCARGAASTAYSADGGFRFEATEEGPRAQPCSDGLIYTTRHVYEATLP